MTLIEDDGWRLWVAKGLIASYYYIGHPGCSRGGNIGASCGMVGLGKFYRKYNSTCIQCGEHPPIQMVGIINILEWER